MRFERSSLGRLARQNGLAAALLGAAAVGVPASQQGAYFPPAWGWSAFGLLLAGALALAFRARIEINALQWALLAGLGSVLLWTALSTVWSDSVPRTVAEVERTTVYVAGIAALLLVVSTATVAWLLGGVLAAVVGVAAYALVDQPTGHGQLNPLSGPLGYWNALGILAAVGLLLAIGFLTSPQLPAPARVASLAAAPPLATTLYLTYSRGALLGLGLGLLVFVFAHPWVSGRRRRLLATAFAAAVLAGLVAGAVLSGGPTELVDRTFSAFRSPPAPHGKRSERLLTVSGNFRTHYWKVAWREYRAHPVLGSGAGTFDLYWDRYRHTQYGSRDAHNLYLETLAELGPLGLILLLVALALPLLGLRGARQSPLIAAAAGAYLAFLVQAAVDWDWEMPAVTLAGLLCGGALTLRTPARRDLTPPQRWTALAAIGVLAIFTGVAWRGNHATSASTDALGQGHYQAALSEARTATRWLPWDSEPWRLIGAAELALGDRQSARTDLRTAVQKDPRDWFLWYELARASSGESRRAALAQATRLNPISVRIQPLPASRR